VQSIRTLENYFGKNNRAEKFSTFSKTMHSLERILSLTLFALPRKMHPHHEVRTGNWSSPQDFRPEKI
jgi:hypothetical protein